MSVKKDFIMLARQPGANISQLCRDFGVSRDTGYRLLRRVAGVAISDLGPEVLSDRSRRPHSSPWRTAAEIEKLILDLRAQRPDWGARKLRHILCEAGWSDLPAPSTITAILRRQEKLDPLACQQAKHFQCFERPEPNQLWQMDFKGDFAVGHGNERCYPLDLLDDHSRFNLGLFACGNQRSETVQGHLTTIFRAYGLPDLILADNGTPWSTCNEHWHWTALRIWLARMNVGMTHGHCFHPQTQGKIERFHRTLGTELLRHHSFDTLADWQSAFDAWRETYNFERPHQALGYDTPAKRYRPSPRPFPERLEPIEYGTDAIVRKVNARGQIRFEYRQFCISKALRGQPVALHPLAECDGMFDVYFCAYKVRTISLHEPDEGDE